jgi:diguanylate cyclase (GGDEF)-like protein
MPPRLKKRLLVNDVEMVLTLGAIAVATAICIYIDAFELLTEFVEQHDSWELDEILLIFVSLGFASFILLFRRARDLRSEIGRREDSERRVTKLSRHDPLTGLPNRRVLGEETEAALARVKASASECAVFLIDLDRFKPVNDSHGHSVGDAVLVEIAGRIAATVGVWGTVARMGGDEFACVISYEAGADRPARLAGQIIRAVAEPLVLDGSTMDVGATIGIARAPHDGATLAELLHAADLAMYQGKREGRGSYRFFHAEMDLALRERTSLEQDLRKAIEAGHIVPHFQPVTDLMAGGIIGFEALARWNHPTKGMIPPDTFIPVAEDLGIIDQVTYNMLRAACIAAREWPAPMWLAVNVSPILLKDPWLASRLLGILTETGFPARRLVIEVTENAVIDDMIKARDIFASLQNAGARVALDDFGKGYSSLYHLRQLHFDHLKIDRSFVHSMSSSESAKIVSAVAGLGKSLGMPVTAEGVESLEEAEALRLLGCEHAQGYLYGKALDAEETMKLLNDQTDAPALARTA